MVSNMRLWLIIAAVATLLCFLPYLSKLKLQDEDLASSFLKSFHTSQYYDCQLVAAAVCVPMIFDFIFDLLNFHDSFRRDHGSRTCLLASIVIPNITTLVLIKPTTDIRLILGFLRLKEMAYIVYFTGYVHTYGTPIWSVRDTVELALYLVFAEFAQHLGPFFTGTASLIFKALGFYLFGYSVMRLAKLSQQWFRYLSNRMIKLKQEEYRITIFLIALVLGFIGSHLIDFIFGVYTYLDLTMWALIAHTFFILVASLVVNVLGARIARREMILFHQIQQLQLMRDEMAERNENDGENEDDYTDSTSNENTPMIPQDTVIDIGQ